MDSVRSPIDDYIAAAPERARPALAALAAILREAAPEAAETIKYRGPVWEGRRILFSISAFRDHAAFVPSAATVDRFRDEIEAAGLDATRQTIRVRYGEPIPRELFARIAADREEDVRLRDARWMR